MTEENLFEDDFLEDVTIYEGEPDFHGPVANEAAEQDELELQSSGIQSVSFFAASDSSTRNWRETIEWYKTHTKASQIGFNPDGMCQKVCRTARNIPSKYASAKQSQDATPREHRITNIADLRAGMIVYLDDPKDSNRFGHIVTVMGRVKGPKLSSLSSLLLMTNSVKAGELVVVRGDYFQKHWGDKFQFGATILNGVVLDHALRKGDKPAKSRVERFNDGGPVYDLKLLAKAAKAGRPKPGNVLRRIEDQILRLPDNPDLGNVRAFKDQWREDRTIDMSLLNKAVENGRTGLVKKVRDEIRLLITLLPDE